MEFGCKLFQSIDVSEVKNTLGVVVKGANNKEVKLEWSDVNQLGSGLFHLRI